MKSLSMRITLAVAVTAWAGILTAQPRPAPFSALDRDNSGAISEQEFNAFRAQRLQSRAAEGRMMRGAANAPGFSYFDADGDGQVTREELQAGQRARMQQRQGRHMGPGMMGGGMQRGPAGGMRHGAPRQAWPQRGPGPGRHMAGFKQFDLDGDGVVSPKEFKRVRAQRQADRAKRGYPMRNRANAPSFADIDANSNGAITAREFAEFRARHQRQRWQQR